jgi:hypothetical protein
MRLTVKRPDAETIAFHSNEKAIKLINQLIVDGELYEGG